MKVKPASIFSDRRPAKSDVSDNDGRTDAKRVTTIALVTDEEIAEIGHRIAVARRAAGLDQTQLAELVGVTARTIQYYEAGQVHQHKRLRVIAEAVGRPLDWLLHGDQPAAISMEQIRDDLASIHDLLRILVDRLPEDVPEPHQPSE